MTGKRFILPMLLVAAGSLFGSCSDRGAERMARQLPEGMHDGFMEYYGYIDYKAFAVAIDPDSGAWAFGSWYASSTQNAAIGNAMLRCKKFKNERDDIKVPCRLFAVGNKLWLGDEAGAR